MPNRTKKWFMLQVWRLQQVAQILTLVLLALNLSLMLYDKMAWRAGLFSTPYTGVPVLLLALAFLIWAVAFVWDIRMKMWREQATVLIERNPYTKEKMASKEVATYALIWLPILDRLGRDDPKLRAAADALRTWVKKGFKDDPRILHDVQDIFEYIGVKNGSELLDLEKK